MRIPVTPIKVPALATLLTIVALCLIPGTATAAGNPCGPAQAALEAGQLAQAEKMYTGLSASQACAGQGLIAVRDLFAAQQLYAAGMPDQAQQNIDQALNTVPLLTLPPGIVPSNPPAPWYARLWHVAERVSGFFGNPVPGSLLAAFVLVAVSSWWAKRRPRLYLHSFAFGAAPVDGADPDEFGEQLRDELNRLAYEYARTDDDRPLRLDLAGPYEDHLKLDTLSDGQSSLAKILLGLAVGPLKWYQGKARLVVGVLHPRIRLRLKVTTVDGEPQQQTLISRDRLALPDADPPDDPAAQFAQLAMPAAAWIILTRYPYALGGTRSWESFAEFAAGWAWEQDGRLDKAEERFEAALRSDPQNLAAKFNLGSLLVQTTTDPRRRQRGLELLREVRDQTEGRTGDLLWYRPRYVLPLAALKSDVPPTAAGQAEAAAQTRELILELIDRDGGDPDVPPRFVENSLGASLVLLARQTNGRCGSTLPANDFLNL